MTQARVDDGLLWSTHEGKEGGLFPSLSFSPLSTQTSMVTGKLRRGGGEAGSFCLGLPHMRQHTLLIPLPLSLSDGEAPHVPRLPSTLHAPHTHSLTHPTSQSRPVSLLLLLLLLPSLALEGRGAGEGKKEKPRMLLPRLFLLPSEF